MIMNLEGMVAAQIHTAKTGKEFKRLFGTWAVSVLKGVKILEKTTVNNSLECPLKVQPLQFLQAQSQPSTCARTGHGARTPLDCGFSFRLASTSAGPLSGLPKCLHWVLHIFNSYSRRFSAGWLETKCICKWGFWKFLLWGTSSGRKMREWEPMT